MEDLDRLQMELEMLLSNVVLRQKTLHSEIALITSAEETKPKKTASLSVAKNVCYIVRVIYSPYRYHFDNYSIIDIDLQKRYKKHEDKPEPSELYSANSNDEKSEMSNGNKDDDDEDSLDDLKVSLFSAQFCLHKQGAHYDPFISGVIRTSSSKKKYTASPPIRSSCQPERRH